VFLQDEFVSVELIAGFKKMQRLTSDLSIVIEALESSSLLELDKDKKRVKGHHHAMILMDAVM